MDSRSRNMWKLLVASVNFNVVILTMEDFAHIEDILCRDPSLISSQKKHDYQDQFVFCLLNKFLANPRSGILFRRNIDLQKILINSILINRPSLFLQIVNYYISVLEEILKFLISNSGTENDIQITINLNKIASGLKHKKNFPYQDLSSFNFNGAEIEGVLQMLLEILTHAHTISSEIQPFAFRKCIPLLLKFKHPKTQHRKFCMKYIDAYLQGISVANISEEYNMTIILEYLYMLWKETRILQQNKSEDIESFKDISTSIIEKIIFYVKKPNFIGHSFKSPLLANQIFTTFLFVIRLEKLTNAAPNKLLTLYRDLIYFLQSVHTKTYIIKKNKWILLQKIILDFPMALCLLYGNLNVERNHTQISTFDALLRKFLHRLEKSDKGLTDIKYLLDFFSSILMLMQTLKTNEETKLFENNNFTTIWRIFEKTISEVNPNAIQLFIKEVINKNQSMVNEFLVQLKIEICITVLADTKLMNIFEHKEIESMLRFIRYSIEKSSEFLADQSKGKCVNFHLLIASVRALSNFGPTATDLKVIEICTEFIKHTLRNKTSHYSRQQKLILCKETIKFLRRTTKGNIVEAFTKNICIDLKLLQTLYKIFFCRLDVKDALESECILTVLVKQHQSSATTHNTTKGINVENMLQIAEAEELKRITLQHLGKVSQLATYLNSQQPSFSNDILQVFPKLLAQKNLSSSLLKNLFFSKNLDSRFLAELAKAMFTIVNTSLTQQPIEKSYQLNIIKTVSVACEHHHLTHELFFLYSKIILYFLVHPNSLVMHEATLMLLESCQSNNIKPRKLWNWHKNDIITLIAKINTLFYLTRGIRLSGSLKYIAKVLGFSCVQEYICNSHRLFMAFFTSHCATADFCRGEVIGISRNMGKSLSSLFTTSFLRIYTHISLLKTFNAKNLIPIIIRCTACTLNELLQINIKKTLSEVLIHFHRSPDFVKSIFDHIFEIEDNGNASEQYISFIADRFLGILTYFKACLSDQNHEKSLKEEIICSLGKIINSIGKEFVTKFRFKIIAMLELILSLREDNILQGKLPQVCLKIWIVFVNSVHTQELKSSINYVAAALETLLPYDINGVNNVFDSLFIKRKYKPQNLPDLYFLQYNRNISPTIKEGLFSKDPLTLKNWPDIVETLKFFYNQISSSNSQLNINGLRYLRHFISVNREQINELVTNEINVHPVYKIIECLICNCFHGDLKLKLFSSKCLGEIGAIDPSYLPLKNILEHEKSEIALSINTDDFAVLALTEFCRIYQEKKGTKYDDNFAIAIQETLSTCGVCPKLNKKMDVWKAMPLRMRQTMIPFLTSCYSTPKRKCECDLHPLFTNCNFRNSSDWAFMWATRLVDFIKDKETNHLLNSYKPSMKRDRYVLEFFFPYILIHALFDCHTENISLIFEEFEAVFAPSNESKKNLITASNISSRREFNVSRYPLNTILQKKNEEICAEELCLDNPESMIMNCSKFCCKLIDFLQRWLYEWRKVNKNNSKENDTTMEFKHDRVEKFLHRFNKLVIAKANFSAGEFTRSLIHLEEYISDSSLNLESQKHMSFLIQVYSKLGDDDSVEGAISLKHGTLTLCEEILFNKITNRSHQTMNCYEELIASSHDNLSKEHIEMVIDCFVYMGTTETALLIAEGLWQKLSQQYVDSFFEGCKLELFWRLGHYDDMNKLLNQRIFYRQSTNWNVQRAQSFSLFKTPINLNDIDEEVEEWNDSSFDNWVEKLDSIRIKMLSTMQNCSSAKKIRSYTCFYFDVIKIHIIGEVEKSKYLLYLFQKTTRKDTSPETEEKFLLETKKFFDDWELRLEIVQPTVEVIMPILNFRRNLLTEMRGFMNGFDRARRPAAFVKSLIQLFDVEIGNIWLRCVSVYRDTDNLQQAHLCLIKSESYSPKILFLEKSKLLWKMRDHTAALKLIEENLDRMGKQCQYNFHSLEDFDSILYAKSKFLQALYSAESMSVCAERNLRYFKEAISQNKNSEKCHLSLAQYMEKIYHSYPEDEKNNENGWKVILEIMLSYAKSLRCGFKYVYQSLPRLLTFWFDYTADFSTSLASNRGNCGGVQPCSDRQTQTLSEEELYRKMNDLIMNCSHIFSVSLFYTTFSQLLSRICHPSNDVFDILRVIVLKLIKAYPQQSYWKLLPLFKSFNNFKAKRCKCILTDSRLGDNKYQKLLTDFNMLTERLVELTKKEVPADYTYSVSDLVKQLPKLFSEPNFSKILLPFEKFMLISFPIVKNKRIQESMLKRDLRDKAFCSSSIPLNLFPHNPAFICKINEEVQVLRSAAKPKKLFFQCDDGLQYSVMVKPKDDLRRDLRLMEFNGLVKRYLNLNMEARHRRLRIRTYAVVPFNEECGLVEWLPNLNSFRSICTSIYRICGKGITDRELRRFLLPKSDSIEKKKQVFLQTLLPNHPPVFHEWFRQRFPTPSSWYEARTSYIRTIAVMSIVGYILGLGDRHGENILFDELTGDAVHVDFNCLFNQGELFAYPELVPFRLTHNMTFAMGPLKFEGSFRKCCEITLRVLNDSSIPLMSVLKPFVYDLVVYNKKQGKPYGEELTDPKAMTDVQRIDDRLQGYVSKTSISSMPLSVKGHVNYLINQATSIENLAAMYIGWAPFM